VNESADKPKRRRRCLKCGELFWPDYLADWRKQSWICEHCFDVAVGHYDVPA
jgi:formylmethanofuran dehydrogenase subunit E